MELVVLPERAGGPLRLARHYIATRYPDAHAAGTPADHYRQSDATAALADSDSIVDAVDEAWGAIKSASDDDEPGQPASAGGPS